MLDDDLLAALIGANEVLRTTDPADLGHAVPACRGWSVYDLLEHIAQVQRWATRIVSAPPGERVARRVEESPTGPAIIDFFATSADTLVDTLRTVDLDHEGYSFVGPGRTRWWLRRQTHEAVIHAWDRQTATDVMLDAGTIDPAIAVDGIDELFELYLDPRLVDTEVFVADGETLHVHATDIDGEWMVRFAPGSVAVTHEHGKGDLALRGPAAELLLAVWNRPPADATAITTFGSPELLERIGGAARL